jgi:hypothetical protein
MKYWNASKILHIWRQYDERTLLEALVRLRGLQGLAFLPMQLWPPHYDDRTLVRITQALNKHETFKQLHDPQDLWIVKHFFIIHIDSLTNYNRSWLLGARMINQVINTYQPVHGVWYWRRRVVPMIWHPWLNTAVLPAWCRGGCGVCGNNHEIIIDRDA